MDAIRQRAQATSTIDLDEVRRDFVEFCRHIRIVTKSGERVPLHLNAIQAAFNTERTGRDVVLKPRQIGFSTLELARDLWTLLCKDGARVVVVCQSVADGSPAKLISGILRIMIESLREAGWDIKFHTEAWNEWVLPNGNSLRIVVAGASESAASKKGRAGTITRLHLTETAFYEYAQETLNALLECVPSRETGSEIVNESTPNGASGAFYNSCKSAQAGKSAYKLHFYPWYAHPEYRVELSPGERFVAADDSERALVADGVTPEQLKWRRLKIEDKGLDAFKQEYPEDPDSCFLVSGRGFFDEQATNRLLEEADKQPLEVRDRDRVRIWRRPDPGRVYLLALDPSEGGGGDPSGGILYERASGEHVATIDGQYTPWELADAAARLGREYNSAEIVVERNNHGHAVLQALERQHAYPELYEHDDGKPGWPTNPVTRPTMLGEFEDSHRRGLWRSPDRGVLAQIRTFVIKASGKPEAANGEKDDLVMAAAIGWAVRQKPSLPMVAPDDAAASLSRWDDFDGEGRGF